MCMFSLVPTCLHCPQVVPFCKFYHNLPSTSAVHVVVMWGSSVSYSFVSVYNVLTATVCVCVWYANKCCMKKILKKGRVTNLRFQENGCNLGILHVQYVTL